MGGRPSGILKPWPARPGNSAAVYENLKSKGRREEEAKSNASGLEMSDPLAIGLPKFPVSSPRALLRLMGSCAGRSGNVGLGEKF